MIMNKNSQKAEKIPFILSLLRQITTRVRFPGSYWVTDQITKYYLSKIQVVTGQIGTYEIDLNLHDTIQQQIFFGIYDPEEIRLVKRLLNPGDAFLDIGANIGYYSFVASQSVGDMGIVIAFEPLPSNINLFHQTILQNRISNIELVPCAVGANQDQLTLFIPADPYQASGWASKVRSKRRTDELIVEMVTLDQYLASNPLPNLKLIKMDIEGAELDALYGAEGLLSGPDAPDLLLEINPYLLRLQNLEPRHILDWVCQHHYKIFQLGGYSLKAVDMAHEIIDTTNIYCKKKFSPGSS